MNKIFTPRIIIVSGGTGGHIYPGIAIADELKKQIPKVNILFIGSKNNMEMQEIPKFGYKIEGICISGGRDKFFSLSGFFILSMELMYSFFFSRRILKKFSPDIVIGTGGYVSFPTLYAAKKNKIPIFIQEQNSFPGFTNRIFSSYAKKVCIAFEESKKYFPKEKTIITGNPVRSEILQLPSREKACFYLGLKMDRPIILSMGGSQGSNSINNAWINGLKKLIHFDIQLIWQVGRMDIHKIKRNHTLSYHKNFIVMEFIENIPICYAAADIIVSRAGALTISEICLIGKPYILIPLPWSSDDHQNRNAKILEDKEAAMIIKNEEIDKKLVDTTIKLLNDPNRKKKMSRNILQLGKPKATNDIVNEILQIIL
ncbi:MAG: undecaprenyldiphospho-muramoylpentapeptide beta-N-acetylglucosaminyltransferase [Flavobacteriales bacterium]|jgi:UDP-N-acetylglucosamine--N-acetylmuramyl-(pentapeptide) pyrophosphoryl-undecaprenol N-acetylglucosamine transferase|uniref:undecaprenyldiphospho-muramoylpentapeptide beta-N-acetylglucosaminyltransferase n=1 Tax=Blattabacterium sp. (Mastotermes darwiniensis) TaxID=39768 RepID=UPI000231DF9B|nr:undecaprenyldiphospho-muramoylpentapeptide beta-N-acetylglucosaminyltransferase [Blattabacterium sp. (Mastotermes darwiniensis)]AER40435.1 undecaprenyldiphospho-muramoylpentapeptide beta-N-acetylglucosaminyltransferase [Blattabacterium sp. (Mastotermes darwiniensis) str. MADAR]MDR1804843.1 undecaprenyldiphospho-muramoylpentapeptide beta-N-acetylglucosaminyltransferase [Flavobacteriales bacterium]